MVRGQVISSKELFGCNSDERTELFENIGISKENLERIWSLPLEQRVIPAAELLYETTGNRYAITALNVSAIIFDNWKGNKTYMLGGHTISKAMNQQKENVNFEMAKRHNIPSTQLLRDYVVDSSYTNEILKVSEHWKNFKLGKADWLRSVRIPEEIDTDVAQLLGIE